MRIHYTVHGTDARSIRDAANREAERFFGLKGGGLVDRIVAHAEATTVDGTILSWSADVVASN